MPPHSTTTLADRDPKVGDGLSIAGQTIWVAYAPDPSAEKLTWDCSTTTREMLLTKNSVGHYGLHWAFTRPVGGMTLEELKPLNLNELDITTPAPKMLFLQGQPFKLKHAEVRPVPVKIRYSTVMVPQAQWNFAGPDEQETLQVEIMDGVQPVTRLTTLLTGKQIAILDTNKKLPRRPWRGAFKGLDSPVRFSWQDRIVYGAIIVFLLWFLFYGPQHLH